MSSAEISEHEPHTASPQPTLPKRSVEPDEPKGSPMRTIVVVLIVLAIVGGVVWKIRSNTQAPAAPGGRQGGGGAGPTPVTVAAVQQKTMPIYLTALGTVTAYNTVTIKTRVDGQLVQVPVREGQAVSTGQLLAQIDPSPYQAALAQAEGMLVKDQATAANAQAEAARYTALLDAGVVSKESQQLQVTSAGQAAGSIAADQAAIQAAKVNLAYTRIVSPIDGVVGLRQVDPGNIVHASDATGLLVVTQLHPIAVIFTLPEDQLPQVQTMMRGKNTLAVEAYDRSNTTHIASGKLLTLDNQIDTTTGMVKAKAVFDNRDNALFPNQFVNVRLILQDRPDALVVPAAALQSGAQGNFVFLVKPGLPPASDTGDGGDGAAAGGGGGGRRARGGAGAGGAGAGGAGAAAGAGAGTGAGAAGGGGGRAGGGGGQGGANAAPFYVEAQPVKVDLTEDAQVILASGVKAGDQVVIDGQEKLRNGSRVSPRDANRPAGGGGGRNRAGGGQGSAQGAGAPAAAGAAQDGASGKGGKGGAGGKNQSGGSRQ